MIRDRIEREFSAYSAWRRRVREAVHGYRDWLKEQRLVDMQTEQRLGRVLGALFDDKLYVAFIAEFSRGKSELINAIFFGQLGQRIVPSGVGRTTMCPTELLYEPEFEPSVRLLPIETRANDTTIIDYKALHDDWYSVPLDPEDPESVSAVLHQLTEVKLVTPATARKLGLPIAEDEGHDDGMRLTRDGQVEIPKWRHAIVNFPHPVLQQGLVILDTPGLNALGAEPELTLSMIHTAHAVIFILTADAGVTKSDMAFWRDHIETGNRSRDAGHLVVLNKIDVLWDELRDAFDVEQEIERQIHSTSQILSVPEERIFPVSAQKALLGKIKNDPSILASSRISELEDALTQVLIPAKQDIVSANVHNELQGIFETIDGLNRQRLRDIDEHIGELQGLNTNNKDVITDMMDKIRSDKQQLERNLQRFQATRSVFARQTSKLYEHLSMRKLERLIAETKKDMALSLTTGGLRTSMVKFFNETTGAIEDAARQSMEIQDLMEGVYGKFQQEHGLAHIKPQRFSTARYRREIRRLIQRHDHFIRGLSMIITEQMVLTRRFYDSVVAQVRRIFQRANVDADEWLRTIMSPMESQVRERQTQLRRRLESIKRIHQASDTLEDRLEELRHIRLGVLDQRREIEGHLTSVETALKHRAATEDETRRTA